jgi:tRNA(fMet)-specific endonuclease VapC
MFVLDTDILSLAFREHDRVARRIRHEEERGEVVAVTTITRVEVLRGRFDHLLKSANKSEWLLAYDLLVKTEERLAEIVILPITEQAADHFERLRAKRKRKKSHADLLVACIALAHDATLVTRNLKDFQGIPGLKLENWAD